jgi:hypothetical protein
MIRSSTLPPPALRRPARPTAPIWAVVALAGWAGVIALGAQLYAVLPRRAGFDLELLLAAGRRVAQGLSPYDPAMLAGQPPSAVDLFYSYPPPVAQYLSLFASVPSVLMLILWGAVAVGGLLIASVALARAIGAPGVGGPATAAGLDLGRVLRSVGLPVLAVAPFVFPFAIAILFGNLDAAFPLLYGLMLVGVLVGGLRTRFGMGARFAGGAGLAIAAIAKLQPSSMGLWFLVRGLRERRAGRRGSSWEVLAAAVAVGAVILGLSLLAGGVSPWLDYVTVLRAGSGADIVDVRNVGLAAQIALVLGGSESLARLAQIVVSAGALALTAWTAWYRDDALESFGWATVASLVVLPITWFHYPVALLPIAVAAWLRSDPRGSRRMVPGLLAGAIAVGVFAVALPVTVWIAVVLVMVAVRRSLERTPAGVAGPALEPSRIRRFPLPGRND